MPDFGSPPPPLVPTPLIPSGAALLAVPINVAPDTSADDWKKALTGEGSPADMTDSGAALTQKASTQTHKNMEEVETNPWLAGLQGFGRGVKASALNVVDAFTPDALVDVSQAKAEAWDGWEDSTTFAINNLAANGARELAIGAVTAGLGTVAAGCRYSVQVRTAAEIGYRTLMVREVANCAESVVSGIDKLTDNDPTNNNWGALEVVLGGTGVFFGTRGLTRSLASPTCFPAGTWVSTGAGFKPIERIEVGDVVWAFNVSSGRWELCPVVDTYAGAYRTELVEITVAGEQITATPGHPFWMIEGEDLESRTCRDHIIEASKRPSNIPGRWVDAGELRVGDALLLKGRTPERVEAARAVPTSGVVYNFAVEGLHTYAVGLNQVLVHNICAAANADSLPSPKGGQAPLNVL
ncbi:MAG TPA: Hint domain-containing protein [Pirellulales bacterium]|jgi:hypothetical protein